MAGSSGARASGSSRRRARRCPVTITTRLVDTVTTPMLLEIVVSGRL
jgi:hypothetical protein